ncbi:MAG: hypothetical protein M3071_16035 [Actinomycetota bacterium]|nr:hypothetical protein [Actinomycetota bacterium]
MHNSARLVKGKSRCTLMIHPRDAETRGLADGESAVVSPRVGEVTLPVEVTEAMRPGVVSIPTAAATIATGPAGAPRRRTPA